MFREPEGTKVVETDCLSAHPNNSDEAKMAVKKDSGAKDNFGPFLSANPLISLSEPKPLLSNMDSGYILTTKNTSFESSNVYPPISLYNTAPIGGGIKSKVMTS